jgi:hypothetical protein
MSRLLPKALGQLSVVALVASLLGGATSAAGEPAAERPPAGAVTVVHAKPTDGHHGTSEATVELPAGGTANVVSPTLPTDATTAKVTVSAPLSDGEGFEQVALALMAQPTPGKKLLACIALTQQSLDVSGFFAAMADEFDVYEALAEQLFAARLEYCMRVAFLVTEFQNNPNARASGLRAGRCGQAPVGIKEQVSHGSGGYTLSAAGPPTAKKKNAAVKVSCKLVDATTTVMTIKPRKKGRTLRQALGGKNLSLAMGSPSNASSGATVTVGFKVP